MYIFFLFLLQEPMIRLGVLITWWSLYLWSALRKAKLPSRSGSYHLWSRWCPAKRRTPHYVEQNWWNIYYGKWLKDKKTNWKPLQIFQPLYIPVYGHILHLPFYFKDMHIWFCIELLQCFYMTVLVSVFFLFHKISCHVFLLKMFSIKPGLTNLIE